MIFTKRAIPFSARGLAKPFRRVVYRVSQIGEPRIQIGDRVVDFKKEVGYWVGIPRIKSACQ